MKFNEKDLIELKGKKVEINYAVPDLEGDQTAIMLKWDGEKWVLSGWGCSVDEEGTEALGWEPLMEGDSEAVLDVATGLMSLIEVNTELNEGE